jgi:hypothetical protein
MAGPSSFVPPKVAPSRTKRRFTLEQANRSLPLVGRIVRDIVAAHQKITVLQGRANGAAARDKTMQKELEGAVDRLQGFVDELTEVGVELKDYQTGLVDFIGRHRGRDVYLCWKLGETKVAYWHELQSGIAGRQPVATLDESE